MHFEKTEVNIRQCGAGLDVSKQEKEELSC